MRYICEIKHNRMKSIQSISIAVFLLFLTFPALANTDPKASDEAMVVCGNARFTILTDRLVRMEWAEDGVFEDRASLAIINRNLPVPAFSCAKEGEGVVIRTGALTLSYKGNGKFTPDNLKVAFKMNGKPVVRQPGASSEGNLRGTIRTLDRIKGRASKTALIHKSREGKISTVELEEGILSRDGWAIVDESTRHLFEKNASDWGEWIVERPAGDRQDLYIFAYGHDYAAALKDFTKVAGNIPLPPRYTLGYWWSRYWKYTDAELLEIASESRSKGVPMDVFIVDMDWHETWKDLESRCGRDEFGQGRGWTGYTWNGDLFPDPQGFLYDLHALGLKTALNLHPASGIRPNEECYTRFVKDYLSRTDDYDGPKNYIYGPEKYKYAGVDKPAGKQGYRAPVPFRLDQQAWADAYFSQVIRPMEDMGVDFWWLDWQQWRESRYVKNLSNTFLCNWAFWNDKARQGISKGLEADRPLIYHRWGGLGSHRYQLGFSGDTYDNWEDLGLLPFFTATASNVAYGYWGHDIGGHMQETPHPTNPEMYTRWLQYGVFTPIFKTHSSYSANLERKIWAYPSHYEYMKAAIRLRYELSPYIYTAAREAFETGISISRPMYYVYPELDEAYTYDKEFFFGADILATVVDSPVEEDGKAGIKVWFPAGCRWYDMASHSFRKGGTVQDLRYSIEENPWYMREGAILTLAPQDLINLQNSSNGDFRLLVIPGKGSYSTTLYEDDGMSQAYEKEFGKTSITKKVSGKTTTINVSAREGSFKGASSDRQISVVMEGADCSKASVRINGNPCEVAFTFDGKASTAVLPRASSTENLKIEIIL